MLKNIPGYKGAFCKDVLPKSFSENSSVVINLQDSIDGGGTHWVCCYGNEYFDSFGVAPPDIVKKYLEKKHSNILFNTSKLQQDDSVLCGYYCCYYISERAKGREALDVLLDFDQFPSDL